MSPARRAALLALLLVGRAGAAPGSPPASAAELLDRLEAAWSARDAVAYAGLWRPDFREAERRFAEQQFGADESQLTLFRPRLLSQRVEGFELRADVFEVREPSGRVAQWLLGVEASGAGWQLASRESLGAIEGLIHLSLDPRGYRADGLRLALEDFELEMREGTLFTSPESVGPTALVFAGRGTVRFRPRPPTEQAQLAVFCGDPELVQEVDRVFVRLNPRDFASLVGPLPLTPDPDSGRRLNDALDWYQRHADRFFVLDASAPRSPWWLLPGSGDAVVTFRAGRRGVLTYSLSRSEPESVSLFDRDKRSQICLYPRDGRDTDYDEDADRAADVLHRSLNLRIDPAQQRIWGSAMLRIRLASAGPTLRLRLDDALGVQSVSSPQAGPLLFFRVRDQDGLMVSLGSLGGTLGTIEIDVRYTGVLAPGPIRDESLQFGAESESRQVPIEGGLVYTNERSWYPRVSSDDHATSSLRVDLPADYTAMSGGRRTLHPAESGRQVVEFEQDRPGRYITLAIARLRPVGELSTGAVTLHASAVARMQSGIAEDLQTAQSIIGYYAREFGPAPFDELQLVGLEGEAPGGHSPPGMLLMVRQPPLLLRRRLRDDPARVPDVPHFFLAHELAHQWWGHGVAAQNYRERWISEAFAHYAAALWVRESQGEDAFQRILRQFGRWARRHSEDGPIHLGYRVGHIARNPQAFRAVVYDKGAYVLHMLRGVVGPDAFRAALTALQSDHRYGKIGSAHVRAALEAASGRELGAYFEAWVFGTELPELRHRWRRVQRGEQHFAEVEVRPLNLPGPVPLQLEIETDTGVERRVLTLPVEGGVFALEVPSRPRDVELNSDRGLLAELKKL